MRASIKFFINEKKKSKKNGKLPLYARITSKGKKAEKQLGLIDLRDLPKWRPDAMRFTDSKMQINRLITAWQTRFDNIIYGELDETRYSANELRDLIAGKKNKKESTIIEFVENYYTNVVLTNQSLVYNTRKGYNKAKNHLMKFLEYDGRSEAKISTLDLPLALRFKDYLLSTNETIKKTAMLEQSAATVVKKLRIIFDRAVDEGMIQNNPFNKVKLKNSSRQKPRLNVHQVKALFTLDLTSNETLRKYRDTFLFSIFTGLAHCDTFLLKHSDLIDTPTGKKLYIKRQKTGIETEQFLPSFAVDIVNRHKSSYESQILNKVLPVRSNKEMNIQLKFIGTMAGISLPLTYHTARHTFRQLISEAGIENQGVIKLMMGHSQRRDIDGTYYSVTEPRLVEAKRKFDVFLTANLAE